MSTKVRQPAILVVEDDPTNALIAATICHRAGYAVQTADNGLAALARLEAQAFDLLLLDMRMPIMDGLELVRHLRADGRWRSVPVVAVTAKADPAEQQVMRDTGVDMVITKPYRNQQLRTAIASALDGGVRSD